MTFIRVCETALLQFKSLVKQVKKDANDGTRVEKSGKSQRHVNIVYSGHIV